MSGSANVHVQRPVLVQGRLIRMIYSLPGDVTSKDEIQRLVRQVAEKEPDGIHLLVNNAGVALEDATRYSNSQPDFKDAQSISDHLWKSDPAAWQETFNTNVSAVYFVSAGFLPLLAKGRVNSPGYAPSIINITSISGVMKGSSSGQFAYASSKAAAIHLTRVMATTFAEAKVRVNSIAPGCFPPPLFPLLSCLPRNLRRPRGPHRANRYSLHRRIPQ